jgi:uncharacterized protein
MALARRTLPRLPNLKAVILEVLPEHLPTVGLAAVRRQLQQVHELWAGVQPARPARPAAASPSARRSRRRSLPGPSPQEWEATLGLLVIGQAGPPGTDASIAADPAVPLYRELANSFRGAALYMTLPLTCHLLKTGLGPVPFRRLAAEFWTEVAPELFTSEEARQFAAFLRRRKPSVPLCEEVLAFEEAILATLVDATTRTVDFPTDPEPVLSALAQGRAPPAAVRGDYAVEVNSAVAKAWAHSRMPPVPLAV